MSDNQLLQPALARLQWTADCLEFGGHTPACAISDTFDEYDAQRTPCTCGWDEVNSVLYSSALTVVRQHIAEQAATIERLRVDLSIKDSRINRLEAALAPFAKTAGTYDNEPNETRFVRAVFAVFDLRRARTALDKSETKE